MDITVKSGSDFTKYYLAPTWDMLSRYREGEGGEVEYTLEYLKRLESNKETIVKFMSTMIHRYAVRDIILGCYCRSGKFCHRHLLSRFLLENVPNVEPGGELNNTSFEMVEGFNPVILSFTNFNDEAEKACQQLIGCEYTLSKSTAATLSGRRSEALIEAMTAISERSGPILDKEGVVAGMDDPNVKIITVKTVDDIYQNFFKRWPVPAPEKPESRFTEWMDELYQQCLPNKGMIK